MPGAGSNLAAYHVAAVAPKDGTVMGIADQSIPLEQALASYDASFTGRKAFQSSTRTNLPRFEVDTSDAQGRLKINPLIDWDASQIEGYFIQHDLPRHPLIAQGYPSIGCSPCTTQVAPGEDPRSGRWKGWDKTECGIHKPGEEPFL
jgi:phosphoadenosine phosphosulfate reductase